VVESWVSETAMVSLPYPLEWSPLLDPLDGAGTDTIGAMCGRTGFRRAGANSGVGELDITPVVGTA